MKKFDGVRFYGYKHWTLEAVPRCFNVGKGVIGRSDVDRGRNHKWHAMVKRLGLRVEVCIGPVTNEEACAWEIEWIAKENTFSTNHSHDDPNDIGCNFTKGGGGVVGRPQTDEERRKRRASLKVTYESPELRQGQSALQKDHWSDDERKQAHVRGIKAQANTPETLAKKRAATTKSWENEETRQKHEAGNARRWSDPAERERHGKAIQLAAQAPGARERRVQAAREINSRPEVKRIKSAKMTAIWVIRKVKAFREKSHTWLTHQRKV